MNPRARLILDEALSELGDGAQLDTISSFEVAGTGRENLTAELQGVAPRKPTWRPHEEQLTVDVGTMSVAWQRRTPRNDQSLRWRRLIYRPDSSGFVDFVAGYGAMREGPGRGVKGLAHRIPHLLLLDVKLRARLVTALPVMIDGQPGDEVGVILDRDTLWLTFSRSPVLLRKVAFRLYQPPRGDATVTWTWDGWHPHQRLGYAPGGHRIDVNGEVFQEVAYTRYEAPATDLASRMTAGDAGPGIMTAVSMAASPDTGLPATGEVAPGVHIERFGGFTVMFVEFQDFLVAVEAPHFSPGLEAIPPGRPESHPTADFIARMRSQFPDKPIRYVVISHHHGDHMGGIRSFAGFGATRPSRSRKGPTILVARGHRAAAEQAFAASHTLAHDEWHGSPADASIEYVWTKRVIEDKTRTLEILNVGKNPHTDENLLVWLPKERIVFQGDLFYDDPMGPFPPSGRGRMNRFTARWLRDHGIRPRAVYGVHNDGASGPGRLAQALKLPE